MADWNLVKNRLNKIIKVDVMSDDECDFLATHMPFKKLSLTYQNTTVEASEDRIYQDLIRNQKNEHRMIIVKGNNGAGKSHLIRWFRAQINRDKDSGNMKDEKVVFIRRIDNTLKGSFQQLLDQNIIVDEEKRRRVQEFLESTQSGSEDKLKTDIYYDFLSHVDNDPENEPYKRLGKAEIHAFLADSQIQNYILKADNSPVNNLFEFIAKSHEAGNSSDSFFTAEYFQKLYEDLSQDFDAGADQKALHFLSRLQEYDEAQKFAQYLNSFTRSVLRNFSHMSKGDAESIIKDLRRSLKAENKTLIFLIEDMTTFTGIDSDLITVLSTAHGGENADLCRVTSVIGITNAYYDHYFRDNYKDRVTHIFISEKVIRS